MKIAFVISCINSKSNGSGGHYYSLLETVFQVSNKYETLIVSIGNVKPKVLDSYNGKLYVLKLNKNINRPLRDLSKIVKKEEVDVLHAFDDLAFFWSRTVSYQEKIKSCLTKCGGRNPKFYYPTSNTLVNFSQENYSYFKNKKKFASSELFFVPNRLRAFDSDKKRILSLYEELPVNMQNSFKFLRISRLGKYYQKSAEQLIRLVKKLRSENINACAIFVGKIESIEVYEELKAIGQGCVFFFTSDEYTIDAKKLIDVSDAVLGTGRSFMEASSEGKILFSPSLDAEVPVLISKDNFAEAFFFNFSERISFRNLDLSSNYNQLKNLIFDVQLKKKYAAFSNSLFKQYFDSDLLVDKMSSIYKVSRIEKRNYIDLLLHRTFLLRKLYKK